LDNAGDVHDLGGDFDECIILLATTKIDSETNKLEMDRTFQLFRDELRSLQKKNVDKIDWMPGLLRAKYSRKAFSGSDFRVAPYLTTGQFGAFFGPSVL